MPDFATRLAEFIAAQRQPPVQSREPIVTTAPRPTQPIPESREERQRRLSENQIRSTLGDSLNALSGGGRPVAANISPVSIALQKQIRGLGVGGTYQPLGDEMASPYERPGGRQVTIHEYGHRRQARTPEGRSALLDRTFAIPDSNKDAASYNRINRAEAYAEAFKSAFEFLDLTRKFPDMPPEQRARMLERRNRAHPGTTRLFNEMLNEPLYANHPLRKPQGGR
jgi:hypothetical protein